MHQPPKLNPTALEIEFGQYINSVYCGDVVGEAYIISSVLQNVGLIHQFQANRL